jgi:hypothetical protein
VFLNKIQKDGSVKELKIHDIEWLSIEDKYFKIMPIMFNIKENKLDKIRSKLKSLIKLRNDIIHLKSKDLEPKTDLNIESIWKRLFDQSKSNPAFISVEIIKTYYMES